MNKFDHDFVLQRTLLLLNWIEKSNYASYDHYDLMSTKIGKFGKRLFAKNKFLGLPIAGLTYFTDMYFPNIRKLLCREMKTAEAVSRVASGYFRLYKITGDDTYLINGCQMLRWLKDNASFSANGLGWGLHFDWQRLINIPQGTPCVTITAYCTDAFLEAYELTKKEEYLAVALKTGDFVLYDLNRKTDSSGIKLSYTPLDHTTVINANSYAVRILLKLLKYDHRQKYDELIEGICHYIISQQNNDGSWFYFDKNDISPKDNMIDSFHTCFVLENLYLVSQRKNSDVIKNAIDKGLDFFLNNFINNDYSISLYHYYPNPTGIKIDIRGCAETINCLVVLSDLYPEALPMAWKVLQWTLNSMQSKAGFFYFRIYWTHKHKMPYMRWGQAPMLNALTNLLVSFKR